MPAAGRTWSSSALDPGLFSTISMCSQFCDVHGKTNPPVLSAMRLQALFPCRLTMPSAASAFPVASLAF